MADIYYCPGDMPESYNENSSHGEHMAPPVRRGRTIQLPDVSLSRKHMLVLFCLAVIALQAGTIYLLFNPPFLKTFNRQQKLVDAVAKLTAVNVFEQPVFRIVSDSEALRKESSVNAEVYANAQNGDYILQFSDKIVIYREAENKLVYDGLSPGQKLQEQGEKVGKALIAKARAQGLITVAEDKLETPQLLLITDPESFKKTDASFYANLKQGDVRAIFSELQLVIIYRPSSDEIVNSGKVETTIR